jgi:flavodoxin
MSKKLVAYFSASGVTAQKAKLLAAAADADLYEIRPAQPYTPADIKWTNPLARCNREWIKKAKIALADANAPVAEHDVIFLAFPIWYYTAPLIIKSFLEAYDFSGKTVVLFATSGGSNMDKCVKTLSPAAPDAVFKEDLMLNGDVSAETLAAVADKF